MLTTPRLAKRAFRWLVDCIVGYTIDEEWWLIPVAIVITMAGVLTVIGYALIAQGTAATARLYNSYHYQTGEQAVCKTGNMPDSDGSWPATVTCWITGPGRDYYYNVKFYNPEHNTPDYARVSVNDLSRK